MISLITALYACSSSPPAGRVQPRDYDEPTEEGDDQGSTLPNTDPPIEPVDAPITPVADASVDGSGDVVDAGAPSSTPKPTPPVGTSCQPGDVVEKQGEVTPFTKTACGDLKAAGDEDFYALSVPTARNVVLRIGAQGDAIARLETPNGNVVVVTGGGTASVGSAAGTAMVRVRSKTGTVQSYRIIAE